MMCNCGSEGRPSAIACFRVPDAMVPVASKGLLADCRACRDAVQLDQAAVPQFKLKRPTSTAGNRDLARALVLTILVVLLYRRTENIVTTRKGRRNGAVPWLGSGTEALVPG